MVFLSMLEQRSLMQNKKVIIFGSSGIVGQNMIVYCPEEVSPIFVRKER
jgi:hypothetical protein